MSDDMTRVSSAQVDRMILAAAHAGPWMIPVFKALKERLINVMFLLRHGDSSVDSLVKSTRPMVAILGDDDDASCGPPGWPAAENAIRWANAVMVNAAGGKAEDYQMAVIKARQCRRVLIIETASRHVEAWLELLAGKAALVIIPRGGQHPIDTHEPWH